MTKIQTKQQEKLKNELTTNRKVDNKQKPKEYIHKTNSKVTKQERREDKLQSKQEDNT
jgi:hypothetical protein